MLQLLFTLPLLLAASAHQVVSVEVASLPPLEASSAQAMPSARPLGVIVAKQGNVIRQVWPLHESAVTDRPQPDRPFARPFGPQRAGAAHTGAVSQDESISPAAATLATVIADSPPIWHGDLR